MARRFRGTTVREGVLLRVGGSWGEWAPFPEYDDATAARWLRGALEAAEGRWPAAVRDTVEVNAIVPALGPQEAAGLVADAVTADGCTTVKVKVGERGQVFDDDVARVAAVRGALDDCGAPQGRVRVDVNGAWSVEEAAERLAVLDDVAGGLEYAEQPCATLEELAALRARCPVPVAVDEGVRLAAVLDAPTVERVRAAADVLVLKAIPLGGVAAALEVAAAVGLPVTVSGSLDSSVGLAAGVALAASLPDPPLACGFGTGRLLAADLTAVTVLPRDGRLSPVRTSPDPDSLARAADRLGPERARWWTARLERCLALVGEDRR
ncbi:MAG: o-succinylbenzoate synthase [Frankiales bacterium]|nr:o-succinylbenzoate synthase [Frankiales bacterium]